ncbi:hypothetical protein ACFSTH_14440 [Paenibacillus yanchengensis]|uniref:hypothetical protein n=1 Tax=Paenibacillus yanchengensis TaxID=2035833 RepID=UPI0036355234
MRADESMGNDGNVQTDESMGNDGKVQTDESMGNDGELETNYRKEVIVQMIWRSRRNFV